MATVTRRTRTLTPTQAILAVAVVAYILPAIAADDPSVALPGVTDLTPENFDAYVGGQKNALVEFYAPVRGRARYPGRPSAPSRD